MLERANHSSALWQQPGFLCDVVALDSGANGVEYLEELPVDFVKESLIRSG